MDFASTYQANEYGTHFKIGTDPKVAEVLEWARTAGIRIRVTYGSLERGEPWEDKPETGKVGRSMGPVKVPLLVKTRRSMGGGEILTHCVLCIEGASSRVVLYQHPNYRPTK